MNVPIQAQVLAGLLGLTTIAIGVYLPRWLARRSQRRTDPPRNADTARENP